MSNKNNGGPAFPVELKSKYYSNNMGSMAGEVRESSSVHVGISVRDYFAAKAMQGFCMLEDLTNTENFENVAKASYAMADAMLKERDK